MQAAVGTVLVWQGTEAILTQSPPSTGLCSFPQCISDSFVSAEGNAEVKREIQMGRTAVRINLETQAGIAPKCFCFLFFRLLQSCH